MPHYSYYDIFLYITQPNTCEELYIISKGQHIYFNARLRCLLTPFSQNHSSPCRGNLHIQQTHFKPFFWQKHSSEEDWFLFIDIHLHQTTFKISGRLVPLSVITGTRASSSTFHPHFVGAQIVIHECLPQYYLKMRFQ